MFEFDIRVFLVVILWSSFVLNSVLANIISLLRKKISKYTLKLCHIINNISMKFYKIICSGRKFSSGTYGNIGRMPECKLHVRNKSKSLVLQKSNRFFYCSVFRQWFFVPSLSFVVEWNVDSLLGPTLEIVVCKLWSKTPMYHTHFVICEVTWYQRIWIWHYSFSDSYIVIQCCDKVCFGPDRQSIANKN